MIAREVVNELRYMAEVYRETAKDMSLDADEKDPYVLDADYLETAAGKLDRGESLSDNERQVVLDELNDWADKDQWSVQPGKRKLLMALADLGDLELWNDETVVVGSKGKKWRYDGKVYRVW